MKKKLTISLVVYNGEKYLPECLDSVFKQNLSDWEMVIIDNHSKDNSVEIIKRKIAEDGSKIKLVCNEKNIGFAAGHNQVIRNTESEYILVLNQDVILEPDNCEKIIKFLDKHKEAGSCIGKIKQWAFQLTKGNKTDKIDTAGLKIFRSFRVIDIGAGEYDEHQYDDKKQIFGVSGCCPIYRRQAIEDIGFFDESFFSYKEDVDLAFRLQHAGWKSYRVGDAIAYHDRSANKGGKNKITANRENRSSLERYLSYRNHLYVLIKNLSWLDLMRYGIFIFSYELKKFIYLLLFERKTLYALIEVGQKFTKMWRKRKARKLKSVRKWVSL